MAIWACVVSIATSVASSIASTIVSPMVEPVRKWLCFPFEYNSNIEKLQKRLEELKEAGERMKHDKNDALNRGQEIEADVMRWLANVDEITKEGKELLDREEKVMSRCVDRLNLKLRHQLSEEAEKALQDIDELINDEVRQRDRVGYRPASQDIATEANTNYLAFQSRNSIIEGLMKALEDVNTNVIGVWGSGGVGKTTLVMEVIRQAKKENLFDKVAMADLTHSPDIRKIQGEIADMLDLKLDEETERGRARHLLQRLTKDKGILIVLDNIWEKLDWEEIGIPWKECKVVLISRNRDVLDKMGIQMDFGLKSLPKEEAWSLFTGILGNTVEGSDFLDTANKIAEKCAGLPIALVTVSKVLKNKSLDEWEDALRRLKRLVPPEHLTEMESTLYSCIKLSYSHLESQEVKYFFLYCARSKYRIGPMDLLKYSYGLGLFSGINTLEEARNNIYRQFRYLKDFGLLQDCPLLDCKFKHYHMHDVVRYVGRLIASEECNMIFVGEGETLKKWFDVDAVKRCEALSISDENIDELGNGIRLPELRFFVMYGRDHSLQISDTFFQEMGKLRVLDFTSMSLLSIPQSLPLLTNLRTLCLDSCTLEDITLIGKLKNLEILSLMRSNISELPKELGLLTHLKLLDLSYSSNLQVIQSNVLSSLVELEELYLGGTSIQWEVDGVSKEGNRASLVELKHLSKLSALEMHIQDACNLPKDLSFEKLKRYKIFIGDDWKWPTEDGTSKILKLKKNVGIQLKGGIRNLLKKIETLYLDELKGINGVLFKLDWGGFQLLKHLQIQNNSEIKYIIDSTMLVIAFFPKLEKLILKHLFNLEEIWHGQLRLKSLCNLRVVKIEHCDKLEFFISSSIASGLSLLEELEIQQCSNMSAIVVKEEDTTEGEHATWFPQLRRLALKQLPKLKGFLGVQISFSASAREIMSAGKCDCYVQILQEKVVFPKLEELELSSIYWEEVQHKRQLARPSCRFTSTPTTSRLQNLLSLTVRGSGNAKHLLSFSTAKSMVRLKFLEIRECSVIEEILLMDDLGVEEETIPKTLFPQLETLYLMDLPIIKWFCKGINIKFPSLKKLKIECCHKFMTFICKLDSLGMTARKELKEMTANESPNTVIEPFFNEMVVFPKLEELIICHIVDLKRVWHNQFAENSFCKLQILQIKLCENLMNVFQAHMLARFQRLNFLQISGCESLQEVFEPQGLNAEVTVARTAIPLKWLILTKLPKLRHVWSNDPHAIFIFQDLQEVFVRGCDSLQSLFTATVARSLPQLEILSVCNCGVKEIIASEDVAQAIDRLVFPRVTHLNLLGLQRLEQFYPGVYTAEWPKLKKIWVQGCRFEPTLSSFDEEPEESHQETSNKKLCFMVDKALAKCVDSAEEFAEDIRNSVIDWKN